jgi:predicted ATPase/DNA-binding SARP family transcriptional activator
MTAPDHAAPPLAIRLFGPFEVRVNGVPIPRLRSRKGEWLLALLALRAGAVERNWLAGTLWPDSAAIHALASLRRSLTDLRRALGPEAGCLRAPTPRTLCLDLSGAAVDVVAFDAAIARGDLPSLESAVSLYQCPLLEECAETWAFEERQAREQAYLGALETLAAHAMARGDPGAAEHPLRLAVAVDPSRESSQRALMQALAADGSYAAALLVYRDLRLLLHRELNATPDSETKALFQQLQVEASRRAQAPSSAPVSVPAAPLARSLQHPLFRSPEASADNLPIQLTSFIGREREMAEVNRLLASNRLLTLTGPGGCGKTRLALQVAVDLPAAYADGVWLVELAAVADPALVPQSVSAALGVREEPGRPLTQTLLDYLRPRSLLLVVDNCEHLLAACAQLAALLLRACPQLSLLASSREGLGIMGERTYRVPSLTLPDLEHLPPVESLQEFEAVQLFTDRAALCHPAFVVTPANTAAVAQICHRLDGIPLAIELAAARVKALPVEKIAERLDDDRFRLLTGGSRTAPPRQQTLRALIDWSYDLLMDAERTLLRRLAVFSGGWSLEAAEGVCTGDGIEGGEVLDLLTSLVAKSMVQYEGREGEARYRLLETLRQYSQDRLLESGETEVVRGRHRDWYLGFAEQAEPGLWGPDQVEWFNRLEGDQDNLRAALAWSHAEAGTGEQGLRLVGALWELWDHRGYWREGRGWMERALARAAALGRTAARAKALSGAGEMAWHQGDYAAGRSLLEESVAIWRELGEKRGLADALNHLGWVAGCEGSCAEQHSLQTESLAIWRELGDKWGIAESLLGLGNVAWHQGDYQAARVRYEESLMLCREAGKKRGVANALGNLADMAYSEGNFGVAHAFHEESLAIRQELGDRGGFASELHSLGDEALGRGDYGTARSHFEESLAIRKELGNRRGMAHAVRSLGRVACRQGDYGAARALYQESLAIHRELGDKSGLARLLADFAGLAAGQRQAQRAARLLGAAEALCEAIDAGPPVTSSTEEVGIKAEVRAELGEAVFAAAWAEGRAMTLEQTIAYAVRKET